MSIQHTPHPSHDMVVNHHDPRTGLTVILAVHRVYAGRGIGGCRMRAYDSVEAATADALKLSEAMTKKNVLAGIQYGGAKAVVIGDPRVDKTPELLASLGAFIERFNGLYVTAPDSGISTEDLYQVETRTQWVVGARREGAPYTAAGVLEAIRASVRAQFGSSDLSGIRIAVQGIGNVGRELCGLLHDADAQLIVADIDESRVQDIVDRTGATAVSPDEIVAADVDVFSPCGLGGTITADAVDRLRARIVAGAANNQLDEPMTGRLMHERGILYAPDVLANPGGVMAGAEEITGFDEEKVLARIATIGPTLRQVFARSREQNVPTSEVVEQLATERIRDRDAS